MVKNQKSPSGLTTGFTYTPSGRRNVMTDPAGVTTTSTWSARGELLTEQVSGRGAKEFNFNPDGTMAWSEDERNNRTTYTYDNAGRTTGRTTPVATEAWGYTNGEMVSYTAPPVGGTARVTTFGRDTAGRVKSVTDPSGRSMTDTFNLAGDLTARVFAQGGTSFGYVYGYDTAGRQNTVVAPDGTYRRTYDLAGRLTANTPADGRYIQYLYDAGGRRNQVTTPEGLEIVYGFDTAGRVQKIGPNSTMADWFNGDNGAAADPSKWTVQTASGGTATLDATRMRLQTTATAGSSAGLTSTAPQTADSTTTVTFQAASGSSANQSKFTVAARQNPANTQGYRVEFVTDSTTASLIKKVAGVDTVLGTFTVPSAGSEIRTQLEVSGSTVRVKAWPIAASTPSTWGVSVTDSSVTAAGATQLRTDRVAGTNSVAIDGYRQRNNQATALTPFVTNTYNSDSQVTAETFAAGSRAYTYTTGRLTKEIQTIAGANRTTDVTYDSAGSIATTAVGGATMTYGYDQSGELLSATPTAGTTLGYTYDAAGRRTTATVGAASTSYTYNSASQLTAVTPSVGTATAMTYDLAGRRTTETTGTAVTTNTYDQAGRLTTLAATNSGTVVTSESRAYTPDGLLRRDTITGAAGAFLRYLKFDWDTNTGGLPQMVSTLDGATNYGLIRNGGKWAATTQGANAVPVASDVFGSVINSTGQNLANSTAWDPYGKPTGATSVVKATLGHRGELTVLSDTYLRARDYQAATGTFTTVDPLDDVVATPTSGNRYHYSYNDPVNRQDPSGMRPRETDRETFGGRSPSGSQHNVDSAKLQRTIEAAIKKCPSLSNLHRATTQFWYEVDFAIRTCTLVFNGTSPIPGLQWAVDYQTEITVGLAVVALVAATAAALAVVGGGGAILGEAGRSTVGVAVTTTAVAGGVAVGVKLAIAAGAIAVSVGGITVVIKNIDAANPPVPDRRRQDREFRDAVQTCQARIGRVLTQDEIRKLHDWITGQKYNYHQIVEECVYLFGGKR